MFQNISEDVTQHILYGMTIKPLQGYFWVIIQCEPTPTESWDQGEFERHRTRKQWGRGGGVYFYIA